ncbi:DUF3034 family protein [Rhizobacter sp. Root404]|uniref:DUF3034 family protein n=1 Tax=Rhizobacter sp. Root404 TaxID=1736528 RepID=UPI0006F63497|nr:hypothetical protein ASC76_08475 [Rhizobacter sp. Root404]
MQSRSTSLRDVALALSLMVATAAQSQTFPTGDGRGKLLLTGGVSSIDGAAGGGLTPWAVIGSYATSGEAGATAFVTRAKTQDYGLTTYGAGVGFRDRVELSLARQAFDAGVVVPDTTLRLDIVGVKIKLGGDAVLDSDTWMPQLAVGAEFKRLNPGDAVGGVLDSVGAKRDGVDLYLSATKLFLAQGILVNGTLRATKANQNGLLGFGATDRRRYRFKPEISVAYLLHRTLAIGAEVRAKPDNLGFAGAAFREHAWKDVFVAWAPSKHLSITAAYVDLGNIVGHERQTGGYLSVQLAY